MKRKRGEQNEDALQFDAAAGEKGNANHVGKRNQRRKGVEIVFDPLALKCVRVADGGRRVRVC